MNSPWKSVLDHVSYPVGATEGMLASVFSIFHTTTWWGPLGDPSPLFFLSSLATAPLHTSLFKGAFSEWDVSTHDLHFPSSLSLFQPFSYGSLGLLPWESLPVDPSVAETTVVSEIHLPDWGYSSVSSSPESLFKCFLLTAPGTSDPSGSSCLYVSPLPVSFAGVRSYTSRIYKYFV